MIELQDCLGRMFTKAQLPAELQLYAQTLPAMKEEKGEIMVQSLWTSS